MATIFENTADVIELPIYRDLLWKEKVINKFAGFTQFITWPLLFIIFHLIFYLKVTGKNNLKLMRDPFIIVSNHVAFYDSFLFRLILGIFTTHLPLRFMAVKKFQWKSLNTLARIGVIDLIYSLFGVFTIIPGLGIHKNLKKAREIIKVGGNIVMYPEGKIIKDDTIGPFKHGAAVLMKEMGVSMIPISFRLGERGWLRRKLYVNVGKPNNVSCDMSVEKVTKSLHDEVEGLYEEMG